MLAKRMLLAISLLFIISIATAQSVNSKVWMQDAAGTKYTGVITAINGDKYNIKYDGHNFSAWLTKDQFVLVTAPAPTTKNTTTTTTNTTTTQKGKSRFDVKMTAEQEAAIPDVKGGMPVLNGTSWAVISIYEKGTTPKTQFRPGNFLFCKSGKWEHQTGTLFLGGLYKVSGTTLSTKDEGAGSKWEDWKLRWDGSVKELEMEQGNLIFVLRYQGKASC